MFGARDSNMSHDFYMNGTCVPVVSETKHLGHTLCNKSVGYINVRTIMRSFNRSVNMLLAQFGALPSCLLAKLFYQYCSSFYGVVLCNFYSSDIQQLYVVWRKCVRRILRVSPRTHCNFLPGLINRPPIECSLLTRLIKFYCTLLCGNNNVTNELAKRCLYQTWSNMGKNVSYLVKHGANMDFTGCENVLKMKEVVYNHNVHVIVKPLEADIELCKELLDVRDGVASMNSLTSSECIELLEYICTI